MSCWVVLPGWWFHPVQNDLEKKTWQVSHSESDPMSAKLSPLRNRWKSSALSTAGAHVFTFSMDPKDSKTKGKGPCYASPGGSTWRRTSQDHCDHHTWPQDQLAPLETASELAASWLDHRKSPALDPNENADADFRPPFLMRKLSKKTDELIALDTRYIIRMYIITHTKTTLFKKSLRSWKKLA